MKNLPAQALLGLALSARAGGGLLGSSQGAGVDWRSYLGDEGRSHYSQLDGIDRDNVHRLRVAWIFHGATGELDSRSQIQGNPLVVDGRVYATTASQTVVALDGVDGREFWRFDPVIDGRSSKRDPRNRGVSYWSGGDSGAVLLAHDHYIYALDAATGKLIPSFGDGGIVDFGSYFLRDGVRAPVGSSTPGVVFGEIYILSTNTSEVRGAAPGKIIAFDIKTGEVVWSFDTIPRPGQYGHETWPAEAWRMAGGANCWAGMALDEERGLLYVPTGSPTYDFWGGDRLGANLFGNSLICLDARTGQRVWHYQLVRHDLWDRDLAAPPTLLTVTRNGTRVPAVAQTTKSGHVFVFDRQSGAPLFPIIEATSPASSLDDEFAWATQPVPVMPAPFSRQFVAYGDLTTLSPDAHSAAVMRFASVKQSVPFQPPSLEGTIVSPGQDGGGQWGGAAADPDGVLYVNGIDTPGILTMVDVRRMLEERGSLGEARFVQLCAGCHSADGSGAAHLNVPSLSGVEGRLGREGILSVINKGRGLMPSFHFLPDADKDDLADYLLGVSGNQKDRVAAPAQTRFQTQRSGESPYGHIFERWVDPDGYPAVKPPWGTLNAIDLNTGEYVWTVPLGEHEELTARGVPATGTNNYGGPIVTAGGVVFIAATPDKRIRAFDKSSGRLLWDAALPAAGYATPSTYEAGGRQYLLIACGGGKLGSASADVYVAFCLPD